MVYSILADTAKNAAHLAIDCTFPRTAPIATITGIVSWYSYQVGMTDSPGMLRDYFAGIIESNLPKPLLNALSLGGWISPGKAVARSFVPTLAPYASLCFSIASSCAVSFSLNLIHMSLIKAQECWKRIFSKESPPINENTHLHVEPGYRKEAEQPPAPAAPKRTIDVPIPNPRSIHDIYLNIPTS